MTVLVVLIVLIVLAIVLVSEPALRRVDEAAGTARAEDVTAALDRLGELERNAAAGLVKGEEVDAARAAIRSQILAAADRAPRFGPVSPRVRQFAGLVAASLLIAGLAGLYQRYDSLNDWYDSPTSSASAPPQEAAAVEALAAATAGQGPSRSLESRPQAQVQPPVQPPVQAPVQAPGQARAQLGSVAEMIDRLVKRLDRNPNDVEGWRMLGWSYLNTDRYGPAVEAYAKAIGLSPDNADLRSAHGEALVRRADGRVTAEAKAAFAAALRLDGRDARARFFMGLAKEQDGDRRAAFDDWIAILNEGDSKEPWFVDLKQRIAALGQELGIDVAAPLRPAVAPGAEAQRAQASTDGSIAADVAEAIAPGDRDAAIRGMVAGLAARLDQSPNDVEGWARLIRSREVLGDTDAAKRTLQRALDVFQSAPQEQARIVAVARELGLMQ